MLSLPMVLLLLLLLSLQLIVSTGSIIIVVVIIHSYFVDRISELLVVLLVVSPSTIATSILNPIIAVIMSSCTLVALFTRCVYIHHVIDCLICMKVSRQAHGVQVPPSHQQGPQHLVLQRSSHGRLHCRSAPASAPGSVPCLLHGGARPAAVRTGQQQPLQQGGGSCCGAGHFLHASWSG